MEPIRDLPDKSLAGFNCASCGSLNFYERPGIENGFSYLEFPKGEVYECDVCKSSMRVQSKYMFCFVRS